MTSDASTVQRDQLYVWVWLPGATSPVVAGVLARTGGRFQDQSVLTFTYARTYRDRDEATSLFAPELPLQAGTFDPTTPDGARRSPLPMHSCLRDSAPDAWGRRIINLRLSASPEAELDEITYLAASDSNRIGALDFQDSPTHYVARGTPATLDELMHAAELVEAGTPLPEDLAAAAGHGTSVGGARPKALLSDRERELIAKFPSSTDSRPVVKAEAVAMLLAARAGIDTAAVEVRRVQGKDVLLIERFDRTVDHTRRAMVSGLTILGVGEMESRHATYVDLADAIRLGPWTSPAATLRELYTRMVFNVYVGNNDDHLRNHAAFWDGTRLELTPAYDIAPSPRNTQVSTQAIGIDRQGRRSSQLWLCRAAASDFLLTPHEAEVIIDHVGTTIRSDWDEVCDQALLTTAERNTLWGREFFNHYAFYDQP